MNTGTADTLMQRLQSIVDKLAADRPEERRVAVEHLSEFVSTIGNDAETLRIRAMAVELVRAIIREIESPLRLLVAERLAQDPNIAPSIVKLLAADEIEVSWPILAGSPVLSEGDLIDVANKGTIQHRVAIAGRADVGLALSDALIAFREKDVVGTVLANERAQISEATYAVVCEMARQWPELEDPLSQRGDLPVAIAYEMLSWITDALHGYLYKRIAMAPDALREIVAAASDKVAADIAAKDGVVPGILGAMLGNWGTWAEDQVGGFVRLAEAGRLDLFEVALAEHLCEPLRLVRKACRTADFGELATMCRANGMSSTNFETIVMALAQLHDHGGRPVAAAMRSFDSLSLAQARGARAIVPGY